MLFVILSGPGAFLLCKHLNKSPTLASMRDSGSLVVVQPYAYNGRALGCIDKNHCVWILSARHLTYSASSKACDGFVNLLVAYLLLRRYRKPRQRPVECVQR